MSAAVSNRRPKGLLYKLVLAVLFLATPLFADGEQDVTDVVSILASSLSESNAQSFLRTLDHGIAEYPQLERDVTALIGQTLISCSVDVIGATGPPTAKTAELDWYMALKLQQDYNIIERRRVKVTMKIEKRGKKWVVTGFQPATLFAPMQVK